MTAQNTTTTAADKYLAAHAELVAARSVEGLSSGVSASLSRRIGQCELELDLLGATYTPYAPPSQVAASLEDKTAEELTAMHAAAIQSRRDATTSGHKPAGTNAVRRIEAEMTRREMPFTPWVAYKTVSGGMTDSDLLARRDALVRLMNAPNLRPRIAKIASKELDQLTMMAEHRGLIDAPAADGPAPDSGKLLDAVDTAVKDAVAKTSRKRTAKVA
jgi:hypothetical protein